MALGNITAIVTMECKVFPWFLTYLTVGKSGSQLGARKCSPEMAKCCCALPLRNNSAEATISGKGKPQGGEVVHEHK